MKRVLVVDDDPSIRNMLSDYLQQNDITVSLASGQQETTRLLATQRFDLMLLDLRLGQEDGLDLLRSLRAQSDLPVIIATGHRRDEIDRVVGLELGADDYILKPFGPRELLARIRVVLRRVESNRGDTRREREQGLVRFAQWTLNRRTRRLSGADGSPVALTKGEYALLTAFLDSPQQILSREQLLQATRLHEDILDRSIDVQILRLRRKLEVDPSAPRVIRTERGVGYIFDLKVEKA
jgi:two-component system, OmpR family, response regulator